MGSTPHALGFTLATSGTAVGLLGWARLRRREAVLPATAVQVEQAVATLAGQVLEQWLAEARASALGDPKPMPVRWRLTRPRPHGPPHRDQPGR